MTIWHGSHSEARRVAAALGVCCEALSAQYTLQWIQGLISHRLRQREVEEKYISTAAPVFDH